MRKILLFIGKDKIVFFLLFGLVILDRTLLLIDFNFKYVGNDDLIFWQAATDYMKGIFHEPYFYGQNYNFMLESLFAIPFIRIGIPYNYAFPICSSLISLFPFFLFSVILFKRGYVVESMFFILIPLLLPIEYGILTSITRGMVSGLFFTGFLIFPLLSPLKKSSWFIAAVSASLGYIFNPNSVIFSLPVCFFLFLFNYRRFSFYWISLVAIIPVLAIEFFAKRFYVLNAEYNVHKMWDVAFNINFLIKNIKKIDMYFEYLTPLVWSYGWFILLIILILGILLLKKEWKKGVTVISGLVFIIACLGIGKVSDYLETVFFSPVRMFLGIPLFSGLVIFWSRRMIDIPDKYLKYALILIAVTTFSVKTGLYPTVIKYHTTETNYQSSAIKNVDELTCECNRIGNLARELYVGLIVFVPRGKLNTPYMEFYNYGCPLLDKKFPKTLLRIYERRTWVYLKEKSSVESNIIIYDAELNVNSIKTEINAAVFSYSPEIHIIRWNSLTTDSLLKRINIKLKRN